MTLYTRGNSGKYLNEDYHETRQQARESLGLFEWGEIEIERYDLDNITFDRKARPTKTQTRVETEGAAGSSHALYKPGYMRE